MSSYKYIKARNLPLYVKGGNTDPNAQCGKAFDFIKSELLKGEDVEFLIDKPTPGSHWVTVVGYGVNGDRLFIYVNDPDDDKEPGTAIWELDKNGVFKSNKGTAMWAVSESFNATYIESCDKDKKVCDIFKPDEKVYVKGIKLKADDKGDIYVVDNQMWTDGMDIKNVKLGAPDNYCVKKDVKAQGNDDFVGSPIELGEVSNDPGPCNIPYQGKYDIVYDVNQNKKYDSDVDLVDKVACTGFEIIPEFTTIAIPITIVLGLMFLFHHRKRKE